MAQASVNIKLDPAEMNVILLALQAHRDLILGTLKESITTEGREQYTPEDRQDMKRQLDITERILSVLR